MRGNGSSQPTAACTDHQYVDVHVPLLINSIHLFVPDTCLKFFDLFTRD